MLGYLPLIYLRSTLSDVMALEKKSAGALQREVTIGACGWRLNLQRHCFVASRLP